MNFYLIFKIFCQYQCIIRKDNTNCFILSVKFCFITLNMDFSCFMKLILMIFLLIIIHCQIYIIEDSNNYHQVKMNYPVKLILI
jgi:hypothetical protein